MVIWCRTYGIIHSDSERGNPQQGLFYMHNPTDRIAHTTAFVIQVVEHWLEREIAFVGVATQ